MTTFLRNPDCLTELIGAIFSQCSSASSTWTHLRQGHDEHNGWEAPSTSTTAGRGGVGGDTFLFKWRSQWFLTGLSQSDGNGHQCLQNCIAASTLGNFLSDKKKEEPSFCSFWSPTQEKNVSWRCTKNKKMKQNLILLHIGSKMIGFLLLIPSWVYSAPTKNATDSYSIQRLVDWRWLRNGERKWDQHSTVVGFLLPDSVAEDSNPSIPRVFQRTELSMLLMLINGAA